MGYFCRVFLDTTDPYTSYDRLFKKDVLISIITHIVLYMLCVYVFCFIFEIKLSKKIYIKILIALAILMTFGYYGRLTRAKTLYNSFLNRGYNNQAAYTKSTDLLRNAYFTFYFLG
tara:strand:+ start:88 stop:435 length:348 start_codon:yes stop_codon:yes gene_type:complete